MAHRQPTLFYGSACKCRKADHIPGRIDMRKVSLKELVHFHLATRIGRQARSFQVELIAIGLPADSINKSVALYSLAALQLRENTTASGLDPNLRYFLCETKRGALLAQMVRERFDDLPIHEIENNRPLVYQGNLGTQGSHKGGVLEAYDAGSHHDDFFRKATQIAKVIGIHNATVVKGNVRAVGGPGTAGNQDLAAFESDRLAIAVQNLHCVRVQK